VHAAKELEYHLNKAYNPSTGHLDLSKLNLSLASTGKTLAGLSA
jgi:hypothetical protein